MLEGHFQVLSSSEVGKPESNQRIVSTHEYALTAMSRHWG
jgi:hypothetical protein